MFREELEVDPERNLIKEFVEQPIEGYLGEEDVIERFQNSTLLIDKHLIKLLEKSKTSKEPKKKGASSGYLTMNYLSDEEQINLHLTIMLKAIAVGGQQFLLENLAYSNALYANGTFKLLASKSQV